MASCRFIPNTTWFRKKASVHWSCWSPPGVPKARYGSPPRSARLGVSVVRGRLPGASVLGSPSVRVNIWARVPRQKPRPGMTGELCSQPPLGVAETRLPNRSATSRWQVSPGPAGQRPAARPGHLPARRGARPGLLRGRLGRGRAGPGGTPHRAGGVAGQPRRLRRRAARPQLRGRRRGRPAPGAAPRSPGQQARPAARRRTADRRTRPPGRRTPAWRTRPRCAGESALPGAMLVQAEPVEQGELLQEHRALAPRAGLAHGQAREVEGDRLLRAGPASRPGRRRAAAPGAVARSRPCTCARAR